MPKLPMALNESVEDVIVRLVTDFVDGRARSHAFVSGGLGTGKSRALGFAALAASAGGARVAWLEQGAVGISSFDDFLASVDEAVSGAAFRPAPAASTDAVVSIVTDDLPLVIVMEGVDQLTRQLRANDRPALLALLEDKHGPLLIGTGVIGSLSDEFAHVFTQLRTTSLSTVEEGVRIAMDRAAGSRVLGPSVQSDLVRASVNLPLGLLNNQAFWSFVGGQLAAASKDPVGRAEVGMRNLVRAHFTALLLRIAPSEQRVLVEIARAGAPRTVQEIAEATNVRNQAAASALARLHSDGWVITIPAPEGADKRRTWYDIADPLLRLHLRPQGAGSVGEMIWSFRGVWQGQASVSSPDDSAESFAARDAEASRRGEAGEPDVARAWFEEALLERTESTGLRSLETLDNYQELATWTGASGDFARAQRMLLTSLDDTESTFGLGSRPALQARSRIAWNLIELGEFPESRRMYATIRELATETGQRDLAAIALQDMGRAVGEQGNAHEATEHMRSAIAEMEALASTLPAAERDSWAERIRRSRHGLAFWLARAGNRDEALAIFDDLLLTPNMSSHDRHSVLLDRGRIVGMTDRPRAIDDLDRLAEEVEASGVDAVLASAARLSSFELAVDEWPTTPSKWPVRTIGRDQLEAAIERVLEAGKLDLQGLAQVLALASGAQVRVLAAQLVATPRPLSPGVRAARARTLAPHLRRAAEQRLLSDLAGALEGDPASEANLPEEWRDVVDGMRALDADDRTTEK